jgi:hypothetical protein
MPGNPQKTEGAPINLRKGFLYGSEAGSRGDLIRMGWGRVSPGSRGRSAGSALASPRSGAATLDRTTSAKRIARARCRQDRRRANDPDNARGHWLPKTVAPARGTRSDGLRGRGQRNTAGTLFWRGHLQWSSLRKSITVVLHGESCGISRPENSTSRFPRS